LRATQSALKNCEEMVEILDDLATKWTQNYIKNQLMNTLNETFKSARVILSLIWGIGKVHEYIRH
jgi:hypothetical protein